MDKLSRLVVLASTLPELYQKLMIQSPRPAIVSFGLSYPFCAWVIKMSFFVYILSLRSIIEAMGSRKHLSSLKDHLDTMLIAMHLCCDTGIFTEDEYVHALIITRQSLDVKLFYVDSFRVIRSPQYPDRDSRQKQ